MSDDAISAFLAQQANEAIQSGADPAKVTAKLGQLVQHLRDHPDRHQMANEAIAQGMAPASVVTKLTSLSSAPTPPKEPDPTLQADGSHAKAGLFQSFGHGVLGGFSEKIGAGAEALLPGAGTIGQRYDQNLAARKAALQQFETAHPTASTVSQLAGAVAPMLMSGGAAGPLQEAGTLAKLGKAGAVGAGYGALYGAGDAHGGVGDYASAMAKGGLVGGAVGAATVPASAAVGYLARKAHLPQAASALSGGIADMLPEGSRPQQAMAQLAAMFGPRGGAATQVARRAEMDTAAGFTPSDAPRGVPMMALDQAGPNVEGLAKNVVRSPGPGRTQIVGALKGRQAQMRPSVEQALAEGTGHGSGTGLADMQALIEKRAAQARQMYGDAREATKGMPMTSPTLDEVLKTPSGKAAFAVAKAQRGNMMEALPTVSTAPSGFSPEEMKIMGLTPESLEAKRALFEQQGIPLPDAMQPGKAEVPDPETLHIMKQHLAKLAKLGVNDGQQGIAAAQAKGALNVWSNIRAELPELWQKADDAYAENSRLIDMLNQGRGVTRLSTNPATTNARKALATSLPAVEQKIATAAPEEQAAFRSGAAHDLSTRLSQLPRRVQSPGELFSRSPERVRQVATAFPTPEAADQFQGHVRSWDDAQARLSRILGGSDTQGNLAEEAARGASGNSAMGALLHGNVGQALTSLVSGVGKESSDASRRQLDAEIARLLTSPDATALSGARTTATLRQQLERLLLRSGAAAGSQAVSP